MSGHSKWSQIKHQKKITDARRGKLFTQLAKEIIVAARDGGDPDLNFRLRMAIQRARDANMPSSNIERAISRGSGTGADAAQLQEITYEGYGPGGVAIMLQTLTDNRNRTASAVRAVFSKAGSSLAEQGSVAWQFSQTGVLMVEAGNEQAEEIALAAIDAGADDFDTYEATLEVRAEPGSLEAVRGALEGLDAAIASSELSMLPTNTVSLDDRTAGQVLRLLDQLEDLDDVQRIYSNADFSDELLEAYQAEE